MKTWKKIALTSTVALAAASLAACGNSSASAAKKVVHLTYANWNLGTKAQNGVERQMVAAWNKANPDIQVSIDETVSTSTNYTGALTTAASAGKLPSVWMSASVANDDQSGWTYDMSSIEKADSEFTGLAQSVQDSVVLKGKNEAIPFGQSQMGFFVNNDLLNKLNLPIPTQNTSVADWVKEVKEATNLSQKYVGVSEAPSEVDWMPGEIDTSYSGLFTYNNSKVDLTSPAMNQSMTTAADLGKNGYSFLQLTAAQQKALSGGTDPNAAFQKGEVAFLYNGTYADANLSTTANFNYSWMGLPGGRQDIELDYLVESKSLNSTEAKDAYAFAKYMSYGETGYKERLALTKKSGQEPAYLPLTQNKTLVADYWKLVNVPGMETATSQVQNAMVDPMKTVPGYINARWNATTGLTVAGTKNATIGDIIQSAGLGQANWADYSAQLQTLSQKQLDTAAAALK